MISVNQETDWKDNMTSEKHTVTRLHARTNGVVVDALDRILNAALDLARLEAAGTQLDPDEQSVLDCCDQIAGLRDIAAGELRGPMPRDPDAPTDRNHPRYDF